MLDQADDSIEILRQIFSDHGIDLTVRDDWLVSTTQPYPPITVEIGSERLQDDQVVIQLDVLVALSAERMLVESFAGWGPTRSDAVARALHNFAVNSLHVLLGAFYVDAEEEQITVEEWRIGNASWTAYIGNFGTQSSAGQPPIPEALFPAIEGELKALRLTDETHWFRHYYANMGNGEVVSEALLDNELRKETSEALARLPWPTPDFFFSVRLFLVLRHHPTQ